MTQIQQNEKKSFKVKILKKVFCQKNGWKVVGGSCKLWEMEVGRGRKEETNARTS